METFFENLSKNAVITASANVENNVYALALGVYNTLTDEQKQVFEVAYNAYQRKIYIAIDYRTQKNTRKEIKANGITRTLVCVAALPEFTHGCQKPLCTRQPVGWSWSLDGY